MLLLTASHDCKQKLNACEKYTKLTCRKNENGINCRKIYVNSSVVYYSNVPNDYTFNETKYNL